MQRDGKGLAIPCASRRVRLIADGNGRESEEHLARRPDSECQSLARLTSAEVTRGRSASSPRHLNRRQAIVGDRYLLRRCGRAHDDLTKIEAIRGDENVRRDPGPTQLDGEGLPVPGSVRGAGKRASVRGRQREEHLARLIGREREPLA